MSAEIVSQIGLEKTRQLSTFYVSGRLYGIDVLQVQEVTKAMAITRVPLAPKYVCGLINLRGQIATAVGLKELFELSQTNIEDHMNVVCRVNGVLFSLLVDQIGDVVEVDSKDFELPPDTITQQVKQFMTGVYKTPGSLLSILDIEKIAEAINK